MAHHHFTLAADLLDQVSENEIARIDVDDFSAA